MKLRFPGDRLTSRERSLHLTRIRNYDHSEYMNWVIDVNKNPDLVKYKSFVYNKKDTEEEKEWKDRVDQMAFNNSEATEKGGEVRKQMKIKKRKNHTDAKITVRQKTSRCMRHMPRRE